MLSKAGNSGWLKKALQRAKEQAQEEGTTLEQVAANRWGVSAVGKNPAELSCICSSSSGIWLSVELTTSVLYSGVVLSLQHFVYSGFAVPTDQ